MLNHLEEPPVIVMGYASYHLCLMENFPKDNCQKAVVEVWSKSKNIEFSPQERLSELRERVKTQYIVRMEHEVIRLTPDQCQYLQPN